MSTVLACLDRSAYATSVCDHAAWLAGPLGASVEVLRVAEPQNGDGEAVEDILTTARERLEHHGVEAARILRSAGDFVEAVEGAGADADVIVLGKRGERTNGRRMTLGSRAEALLRQTTKSLCLVSQIYLPISRALVLIDSDPDHRRAVETVSRLPVLSDLDLDIILMGSADDEPAAAKLAWAREAVGACEANIFPLDAETPDEASAQYMEDHQVDLIVMSREMLLDPKFSGPRGAGLRRRALWGWRTPLFIC